MSIKHRQEQHNAMHSDGNSAAREVFNELFEIIEETILLYKEDNKQLPAPISGKELVNKLQKVA